MKSFSRICGALVALVGILVLLGWAADVEALKRVAPGLVAMNPLTALAFVLGGICLSLSAQKTSGTVVGRGVAMVCAVAVALIGLLKFGGYLLDREVSLDQLLFTAKLAGNQFGPPNRMAPNTAFTFLLCGSALLLLDVKLAKRFYPAPLLSLVAAALALLAVTGYGLGTTSFYHVGTYIPMALHTALAFLLLSSGILAARPGVGPMRVLCGRNMGGATMRRLLPAAVLVPFCLGLLWQLGARRGDFDPQLGIPLMVVSSIACFAAVIFLNALSLEKSDAERKRVEQALRRSSAQIHDLYNQAPCGYHSVDANGVFLAINDTELAWLGYTRTELIGKVSIASLMTPASRAHFQNTFALLKQQGQVHDVEYELVRKDGTIMPILLNATGFEDEEDHHFFTRASIFDITRRKLAEEDRQLFFTLSLDLFCIAGFDGRFKTINQAWEKSLGYSDDELLAAPFIDFVHPEDRAATVAVAEDLSHGGNTISFANRYRAKDGSYRWLLWSATPAVERQLIFAVARDITEQKLADDAFKQLNEELRQRTAQLETLNRELEAFSYSVSHDLRAPVRHISGFADLLSKQEVGPDPKARRYLGFIMDSARQMGRLVDDLLSFSRMARSEMHVVPVNLDEMVAEVRNQLADACANRNINWRIGRLPQLRADAAMLHLVMVNLLSNAVKYTSKRPQAEIEIAWQPGVEEDTLSVRDNGAGFDMKYVGKLFGVFQRLHHNDEFEGTGIGLANVRRIIHRHGGRVWAEGVIDQGATFFFTLPKPLKSAAAAAS